jgi:hypothetical protein
MPLVIDDQGSSPSILFMRLKAGIISDIEYRDRQGWRLLAPARMTTIGAKICHPTVTGEEK